MSKLTRRNFISFLGFGTLMTMWPISLFRKGSKAQVNSETKEILTLLMKKRNSISTLSYVVTRTIVYADPSLFNNSKKEMPPMNALLEVYYNKDGNLKTVMFILTVSVPQGFGAKITTIYKGKYEYQKTESLDGSFRTEYHSSLLSYLEMEKIPSFLDDVLAMPTDNLMTLVGREYIDEELTHVIVQGNSKYWISLNKASVVKREYYRSSDTLSAIVEYKNFKEVYPGIIFPTLVIDKNFDKQNNLVEEYTREITNIRINELMPKETFNIEKNEGSTKVFS